MGKRKLGRFSREKPISAENRLYLPISYSLNPEKQRDDTDFCLVGTEQGRWGEMKFIYSQGHKPWFIRNERMLPHNLLFQLIKARALAPYDMYKVYKNLRSNFERENPGQKIDELPSKTISRAMNYKIKLSSGENKKDTTVEDFLISLDRVYRNYR